MMSIPNPARRAYLERARVLFSTVTAAQWGRITTGNETYQASMREMIAEQGEMIDFLAERLPPEPLNAEQNSELDRAFASFDERVGSKPRYALGALWRLLDQVMVILALPATMPPVSVDGLGGSAPVQGEGRMAGRAWYFRARHDGWSLSWAHDASEPDAVAVGAGIDGIIASANYACERDDCSHEYCAGWMPVRTSIWIVINALVALAGQSPADAAPGGTLMRVDCLDNCATRR